MSKTTVPVAVICVTDSVVLVHVAHVPNPQIDPAYAGADLTVFACDDANSTGSLANRRATFNVGAGETVTATFTNTKLAKVLVTTLVVGCTNTFSYTATTVGDISVN